jgi:ribosomal protein L7Ae-like RNA K-turn-binding protein
MVGLVLAARRAGALVVGADATLEALRQGAPLAIVAADAGTIAAETYRVIADQAEEPVAHPNIRLIAWKTKSELGGLLAQEAVAICGVRHAAIASELKRLRAAVDAAQASRMTVEAPHARKRTEPNADEAPHARKRTEPGDEGGPHARERTGPKDEVGAECSRRPEVR